jgi:hypothetical protein
MSYPVAGTDIVVSNLRELILFLEGCETAGDMASSIDYKVGDIMMNLMMLARSAECRRTFLLNREATDAGTPVTG